MDEKRSSIRQRVVCVAAVGAAVYALLLSSLFWNLAAAHWQHKRNPGSGTFYSVEGRQMHIDCSGTGSPTVILGAAASAPWSEWRMVPPGLSHVTQVCSYDRAGHGWSEPRTGPRDAE